jgi:hypothetical protein
MPLAPPDPPFTGAFRRLYGRVTDEIRAFEESLIDNDEVTTIEYLISTFYREYQRWASPGALRDHLTRMQSQFHHLAALTLMSHAYIHMAYDLPRCIADALAEFKGTSAVKLMRARFLELEAGFERVADETAGAKRILGRLAWLNRAVPKQWRLSYIFAMWVLRIRSNACLCCGELA